MRRLARHEVSQPVLASCMSRERQALGAEDGAVDLKTWVRYFHAAYARTSAGSLMKEIGLSLDVKYILKMTGKLPIVSCARCRITWMMGPANDGAIGNGVETRTGKKISGSRLY